MKISLIPVIIKLNRPMAKPNLKTNFKFFHLCMCVLAQSTQVQKRTCLSSLFSHCLFYSKTISILISIVAFKLLIILCVFYKYKNIFIVSSLLNIGIVK